MHQGPPPLVVHIIYALGTGGLENGLVNIINRAPSDHYRHAIVCLTSSGEFADRLTQADVTIYALDKRPGHDFRAYWRLFRLLWKLRPAIIHTRNLAALETQVLSLFLPRVRRVHGEHGRDIYDLDGSNRKYLLLRRFLKPFIHRYIAVSRDLADWLVSRVGIPDKAVRQIYNGVDLVSFHPRASLRPDLAPGGFVPAEGIVLGTVGRLAEVKDQASLVEAFSRLVAERPELRTRLRLVLIGDGPLFESLKGLLETRGITDLVWMTGDRKDVPELLRLLDIFVLPSLAEGISNTILEAMATRLPVIATKTGGNPELVDDGENGLLVPVGDVQALAKAIEELVSDPSVAVAMGARGYEKVSARFNWTHTVNEYLGVYDGVLGRSR